MDGYQAIYDATRSRINNGDVGAAVERAIRDANISHYFMLACDGLGHAADDMARPSVLFRPDVAIDGNKYSVLYGTNLMEGCAGHGDSLAEAMADFDKNWHRKLSETGLVAARAPCERCNGTGAIDAAHSGVDPYCIDCDGTGRVLTP